MEKEMNFFDLCVACGRAIGRGCKALWQLCSRMIRLTYRYWWLVITLVILAVAAAFYYSRYDNLKFRVSAVALLNGPTIPQFEKALAPVTTGQMLPENARIAGYIYSHVVSDFKTYRVIDCKDDGTPDYVDYKNKVALTDTLKVPMTDRLCVQFCIKVRDMGALPDIEKSILELVNRNPALQQSYQVYLPNLCEQVAFNHRQWNKLDSLTSHYYYRGRLGESENLRDGMVMVNNSDWKVRLFLDEVYAQQAHTEQGDYRLKLAYAPVTLENHFAVDSAPSNSRRKCLPVGLLLGWIIGCAIAELIDRRKAVAAWLKQ